MPNAVHLLKTRTWLLTSITALTGVFLALALAETTLRVFQLVPAGGLPTVTQQEFDRVPGLFAPNKRVMERTVPQLPYQVTIDSLGYRGLSQLSRLKPADEVRILTLGDSFTFGYLVNDNQTLPAQLERLIQSRCGRAVRLINAGVGGTSIEAAAEMAGRALPLAIDIAVLTFTENDVTDLAGSMWRDLAANRKAKSRFPMSVVYPVVRQLALWNLLLEVRSRLRNLRAPSSATVDTGDSAAPTGRKSVQIYRLVPDSVLLRLRQEYQQRLLLLRDRLATRSIPLLLVVYPSDVAIYGGTAEQVHWVEAMALSLGIPTVDLIDTLRRDGRPKEELYMFPYDGHPSPEGYAVVAPVVAERLTTFSRLSNQCGVPVAATSLTAPAQPVN